MNFALMLSPSSRRAWIEIQVRERGADGHLQSPSSRRAWIEIRLLKLSIFERMSPSSRRAWIEMLIEIKFERINSVALLAEGVDRNRDVPKLLLCDGHVALLAEGVDRNLCVA